MKMKLLPLFLMFVIIFSVVQPISAANRGDTKITGWDEEPLTNIREHDGNHVYLDVKLYVYELFHYQYSPLGWYDMPDKELVCQLYKENPDGTNGQLVWSDTIETSSHRCRATIHPPFLQKGKYNLDIIYADTDNNEKPCKTSIKIEVVGKNHL